ncbi:MAG: c-type cytochrome, partial [Flavobacteriales bacterium]
VAGNEPPVLSLEMHKNNKSFYVPNASLDYAIKVFDKEDGSLDKGINSEEVAVNIDYLAEGFDKIEIAQGHRSADESTQYAVGKKAMDASDCMACHKSKEKSIGPSYLEVAKKYKDDPKALDYLSTKIISGGGGVWGEMAMAAHPQLSTKEASDIALYILSLADQKPKEKTLPTKGSFVAKVPDNDQGNGVYIVRASYSDKGANGMPSLQAEKSFVLRSSKIDVHGFDAYVDVNKMSFGGNNLVIPAKSDAYMVLNQIDLAGISAIQFAAAAPIAQLNAAGGKIEVRLGSPQGILLGETDFIKASDANGFAPSILTAPITLNKDYDGTPQDVYLVFVNKNAGEGQSLMVVMGIEIKMNTK